MARNATQQSLPVGELSVLKKRYRDPYPAMKLFFLVLVQFFSLVNVSPAEKHLATDGKTTVMTLMNPKSGMSLRVQDSRPRLYGRLFKISSKSEGFYTQFTGCLNIFEKGSGA